MPTHASVPTLPVFLSRSPLSVLIGCAFASLGGLVQAQTTNTPPSGYVWCATESKQCRFTGTASVVYGARTTWTTPRTFTGGVTCNNATFGDPLSGVLKACYLKLATAPAPAPAPAPTPAVNSPPLGYSLCAA